MGFRLVPKSVTLNDFERRNGHILHYFAEFGSFRQRQSPETFRIGDLVWLTLLSIPEVYCVIS